MKSRRCRCHRPDLLSRVKFPAQLGTVVKSRRCGRLPQKGNFMESVEIRIGLESVSPEKKEEIKDALSMALAKYHMAHIKQYGYAPFGQEFEVKITAKQAEKKSVEDYGIEQMSMEDATA